MAERDHNERQHSYGDRRPMGKDSGPPQGMDGDQDKRRLYLRRKTCKFCADKSAKIDYKDPEILKRFITLGGKIIPRRMSGNCARHQRQLAHTIKISRYVALLPYVKQ
jgi:small subunit ribosomal protein S18